MTSLKSGWLLSRNGEPETSELVSKSLMPALKRVFQLEESEERFNSVRLSPSWVEDSVSIPGSRDAPTDVESREEDGGLRLGSWSKVTSVVCLRSCIHRGKEAVAES